MKASLTFIKGAQDAPYSIQSIELDEKSLPMRS